MGGGDPRPHCSAPMIGLLHLVFKPTVSRIPATSLRNEKVIGAGIEPARTRPGEPAGDERSGEWAKANGSQG